MAKAGDRPAPIEVVNPAGRSDVVLLCEHASNHMPAEYGGLGLPGEQLLRHIAWDISATAMTRRLSALLDAPAFLDTFSRLLIDLNRPLTAPDSIPTASEGTPIPGNERLAAGEVARRIAVMFTPFHDAVAAHLHARQQEGRPTRLVSIHSFTPVLFGIARPWHAGVLFADAAGLADAILVHLQDPELLVAANVPYKTDRAGDYAIPIHGDDRDIPAVMIEIRNDLIDQPRGASEWAVRLSTALGLNAA